MSVDKDIGDVVYDGGSAFSEYVRGPEFAGLIQQLYPSLAPDVQATSSSLPVGTVVSYAGNTAPALWLICDGHTLTDDEKRRYPDLAQMLSAVPDLRGRVIVGVGNDQTAGNNADRALLQRGGDIRLQRHNHGGNTDGNTARVHFYGAANGAGLVGYAMNGAPSAGGWGVAESENYGMYAANHNHPISNDGAGESGNMPPFTVLNYIIKAG